MNVERKVHRQGHQQTLLFSETAMYSLAEAARAADSSTPRRATRLGVKGTGCPAWEVDVSSCRSQEEVATSTRAPLTSTQNAPDVCGQKEGWTERRGVYSVSWEASGGQNVTNCHRWTSVQAMPLNTGPLGGRLTSVDGGPRLCGWRRVHVFWKHQRWPPVSGGRTAARWSWWCWQVLRELRGSFKPRCHGAASER